MHRFNNLILLFLLCLANYPAVASEKPDPRLGFEEYGVNIDTGLPKSVTVDLSSHPSARMFRTRLRQGASEGVNFAGHYTLVHWGCGNECQQSLLVDLRTGQVVGLEGGDSPLTSARGLSFRKDSRLLIADPPCPEPKHRCGCLSMGRYKTPVRYYLVENDGLRLVKTQGQNCGAYENVSQ